MNAEQILQESFLDYSAYVLQRRALPDIRDGMKYSARQILHAQYRDKLDAAHPFKKSQKSVAAATSFSYVHGGASAYGQLVRMGRPLVQRYFLEEFKGNGGTPIDSQDYAAERYTETRLSKLAMRMFDGFNREALSDADFAPTYDDEGLFPLVLPAMGFYNLVNGSFGSIGVGLISSIPQFNLREMNAVITTLIDNPDAEFVLLPDFASGGVLMNPKTVETSLSAGEGKSAILRGVITHNEKEGFVEILELPYGVYTKTICQELEKAFNKGVTIFSTFKDLSKTSVQIRVYGDDLEALENWLFKNTSCQKHFTIKLMGLNNGKTPKLFTLREALLAHINHAALMFRRQYEYQLRQLKDREEVLRGLIKAHSIVDQIIAAIRNVDGGKAAVCEMLVDTFAFTARQADAIAEVKTHRWSSLDVTQLNGELNENLAEQAEINEILSDQKRFDAELKAIYDDVARDFGDERRTKVNSHYDWESGQDGTYPTKNYRFRLTPDNGYETSEVDFEEGHPGKEIPISTEVIIVTNTLRGFKRQADKLLLGANSWGEVLSLSEGEKVIWAGAKEEINPDWFMTFIAADGERLALHSSFVLLGSSIRGRKLLSGKKPYDVKAEGIYQMPKGARML